MPQLSLEASTAQAICRVEYKPGRAQRQVVSASRFALDLSQRVLFTLFDTILVGPQGEPVVSVPGRLTHQRYPPTAARVGSIVVLYPPGVPAPAHDYRIFAAAELATARLNSWQNIAVASVGELAAMIAIDQPAHWQDGDQPAIVSRRGSRLAMQSLSRAVENDITQYTEVPRTAWDVARRVMVLGSVLLDPTFKALGRTFSLGVRDQPLTCGEVIVADLEDSGQ